MTIKRKIIIFISGIIITIGLVVYLVIIPTINDITKISNAIYAERVDLEKKYLRGQLLRKTIEDFEKIKAEQDKLTNIFIIEGEELKFITALEKIAVNHNLIQDIQLQPNKSNSEGKNSYALPLSVTVKGNFIKTLQYLNDLEKINYYFNVSSIRINSMGQQKEELENGIISILLSGEIYVLANTEEKE